MESNDTSAADGSHNHNQSRQQQPHLPPGFRFHPTDEELLVHYLRRKAQSAPLPISIIAEVDLYKFDPWELPEKAVFGEHEWYFFSPRDRKYPNGARPNRAATSGYWKATGTDKPVMSGGNQKVGVKKALVFYGGKPPRGQKTNWIMHEYRLVDGNKPPNSYDHSHNKKKSLRLDDWVLCRIYKKNNVYRAVDQDLEDPMGSMSSLPHPISCNPGPPKSSLSLSYMESSSHDDQGLCFHQRMMGTQQFDPTINPMLPSTSNLNPSLPLKRPFTSLYWAEGGGAPSNSNDQHDYTNDVDNSNNGQLLPHDAVFMQPYQLSGLNWYS